MMLARKILFLPNLGECPLPSPSPAPTPMNLNGPSPQFDSTSYVRSSSSEINKSKQEATCWPYVRQLYMLCCRGVPLVASDKLLVWMVLEESNTLE